PNVGVSALELSSAINAMVCSALSGGASQNVGNVPRIDLVSLSNCESTSGGKNISSWLTDTRSTLCVDSERMAALVFASAARKAAAFSVFDPSAETWSG